jgi:hypothetical protein
MSRGCTKTLKQYLWGVIILNIKWKQVTCPCTSFQGIGEIITEIFYECYVRCFLRFCSLNPVSDAVINDPTHMTTWTIAGSETACWTKTASLKFVPIQVTIVLFCVLRFGVSLAICSCWWVGILETEMTFRLMVPQWLCTLMLMAILGQSKSFWMAKNRTYNCFKFTPRMLFIACAILLGICSP